MIDIAANVSTYLGERSPTERASSFDYCFNYFQGFKDRDAMGEIADSKHVESSCLHLGYYLASWGMFRGSTALHTKSYRFFENTIEVVASEPMMTWSIDADSYDTANIDALLKTEQRLVAALTPVLSEEATNRTATRTLVTKVMLGVFGSVPAFDTYFVRGIRAATGRGTTFSRRGLIKIAKFYEDYRDDIDAISTATLDGATGVATLRRYTKAKIIDMVLLIEGGGS